MPCHYCHDACHIADFAAPVAAWCHWLRRRHWWYTLLPPLPYIHAWPLLSLRHWLLLLRVDITGFFSHCIHSCRRCATAFADAASRWQRLIRRYTHAAAAAAMILLRCRCHCHAASFRWWLSCRDTAIASYAAFTRHYAIITLSYYYDAISGCWLLRCCHFHYYCWLLIVLHSLTPLRWWWLRVFAIIAAATATLIDYWYIHGHMLHYFRPF